MGKTRQKVLAIHLNHLPRPPPRPPLHRHQELHTCHTRKHTRMYTKSSNAQLTLSQRQSSKLVSKQTKPQLTAVTKKKTDANIDFCSQWMSSPLISRAARHLMSFVMDANYAYQFIPTSTQYFTNAPGCRKKNAVSKTLEIINRRLFAVFFHRFNIVP